MSWLSRVLIWHLVTSLYLTPQELRRLCMVCGEDMTSLNDAQAVD